MTTLTLNFIFNFFGLLAHNPVIQNFLKVYKMLNTTKPEQMSSQIFKNGEKSFRSFSENDCRKVS